MFRGSVLISIQRKGEHADVTCIHVAQFYLRASVITFSVFFKSLNLRMSIVLHETAGREIHLEYAPLHYIRWLLGFCQKFSRNFLLQLNLYKILFSVKIF